MDTTIRTLRLETSKKGGPNAPPSSEGSNQRDHTFPIPKESDSPSIGWELLDS